MQKQGLPAPGEMLGSQCSPARGWHLSELTLFSSGVGSPVTEMKGIIFLPSYRIGLMVGICNGRVTD